jgi:hypothetical protein
VAVNCWFVLTGTETVVGEMDTVTPLTVKDTGADVPPGLSGFVTVTGNVPLTARSLAGTIAVRSLGSKKVVAKDCPLKLADVSGAKLEPASATVNCGLVTSAIFGVTLLRVGPKHVVVACANVVENRGRSGLE